MSGVFYQEERSLAAPCSTLDVGKRLPIQGATRDVEGEGQGHVVFRVHQQTQIGAENSSHGPFYLFQ